MPWSGQFSTFSMESYTGNINLHNLSKGGLCVSNSSLTIKWENVRESYQEDPVLYTMSAASFVLAFFATVSILLPVILQQ
jgi:hypothetical protein